MMRVVVKMAGFDGGGNDDDGSYIDGEDRFL